MWRVWYEVMSLGERANRATVMNYGYAPLDGFDADRWPADHRFGLQLYAKVAGPGDLIDKDVLEIGCGRGGGAAFVHEHFRPRSMTGLDLARKAIDRCRANHARPGLEFVAGDAENLPFREGTFDAVLSVESSHCYADLPRFLREVHRVLRSNGLLLLADLRLTALTDDNDGALFPRDDVRRLREQLAEAGFRAVEEENITANVVRALELNTPDMRARIERQVPKFLRKPMLAWAATEGSPMYQSFAEGETSYLRFVLERL